MLSRNSILALKFILPGGSTEVFASSQIGTYEEAARASSGQNDAFLNELF